ncbi:IclR family transcriptional regulator [Ancylobacter polymorphus]|uniref:DNA-binding IclR family transcriptional regulator n=1 Tax=Ancylobacter polymorphus TaxID=223390 RepID=A0ABU0BI38_9HYPH|nr:IclR family transcriptional regulator [Ancylobacter polymorphus]MDQ0304943.1 DNA-binding IclR family transcriptional regulator [Ancylobacter polymorphus]
MNQMILSSDDSRERVEAVERAIVLLQCFEEPGEALTLAALAQRSGLYKSTILRLVGSLLHTGFLRRTPNDGRYMLGPELRRLGELSRSKLTLEATVRPILRRLTAATHETASFYVRDGDERICLYRENSPLSARHHLEEGMRHPLGLGAAGLVLTHFGNPGEDEAARELRETGSIVSRGGRDPDLSAVAVPVANQFSEVIGALTVSGLINRFGAEEIAAARKLLIEVAGSLTPRLPRLEDIDLRRSGDS